MYPNYPNQQPGYPNSNFGFNTNSGPGFNGSSPYPQAPNAGFPTPNFNDQPSSGFQPPQPSYPSQPAYPNYPSQSFPTYPSSHSDNFPIYPNNPNPNPSYGSNSSFPPFQPPPSVPGSNSSYPPFQPPPAQGSNSSYPPFQPPSGPNANSSYPPSFNPVPQPGPNQFPSASNTFPSGPSANSNSGLFPNLGSNLGANSSLPNVVSSPAVVYQPTLRPYQPFDPSDDASKLYKAMKGFGTDETTMINILCQRTSQQRQEIALSFKTCFGKDLYKNIQSELGGNLQLFFKALMFTPSQLEAHDLKKAIEGAGTDEASLIDIICTKTNQEMTELKQAYKFLYHKDVEHEVRGDASGYFKRILTSLIVGHRSDSPPNQEKAARQAKELYQAGEKRLGTDEVKFNQIFAAESFAHLKLVFEEYQRLTGHDIEKAIKSEMSGDVERAFLAIANVAKNPAGYWAQRLYESMKGAGTYDRSLIRIMVLRSEKDMILIKSEFQRRYGKSLESFIKGDTSGDYRRALLCLAGDSHWK